MVPRFDHLTKDETYMEIIKAEKRLGALNMMRGLSAAINVITGYKKGWSYHLIILNSLKHTIQVKPYDRDSFEQAINEYGKVEAEAAKGQRIEPVLVSAGPLDKLRRAYPNYFLDINDFAEQVKAIISATRS